MSTADETTTAKIKIIANVLAPLNMVTSLLLDPTRLESEASLLLPCARSGSVSEKDKKLAVTMGMHSAQKAIAASRAIKP